MAKILDPALFAVTPAHFTDNTGSFIVTPTNLDVCPANFIV